MLGQRREQLLAGALLHVERAAVADQRGDVHEAVVGGLVCDPELVGAVSAHAQAAEREHAGLERARVQLVEQLVERDVALDVCGILDDQMRQDESRRALT